MGMSEADVSEFQEKKIFKIEDRTRLQNMNRVPVIKITQSSTPPSLPVTTFKNIHPSNNIENVVIKTEPVEETDNPSPSIIPFHDIANQTAIVRTFPFPVTTTSSSLIFPPVPSTEIKKEL